MINATDIQKRRLLLLALLFAVFFHGYLLIFRKLYARTYDAYVHIFFASKYQNVFRIPWVYNWFDGFELTSYPPLVPQLISIFGRLGGLENGYIATQMLAVCMFVLGAYRFSRLWVDGAPAAYVALSAAMSTVLAQQMYQFGQLPTCFATGACLHAGYHFAKWCGTGHRLNFAGALFYLSVTAMAHHLTIFLFAPAALSVVFCTLTLSSRDSQISIRKIVGRGLSFGVLALIMISCMLHPFLEFALFEVPRQVEIPHATRENFLNHPSLMLNFFVTPMATVAVSFLAVPFLFVRFRLFRPLIALVLLFCVFGLGGTTGVPKVFFRNYWSVLTFDRFAAWASILLFPVLAAAIAMVPKNVYRWVLIVFQALLVVTYLYLLSGVKFQPDPLDLRPVAKFLDTPQNKKFRYLTLGFGSQMAKLSFMTEAPTVDGLYFTSRTVKVLRESGIEAIDSAKYFGDRGINVLSEYLTNPSRYSLKFVLVNDAYYNSILTERKWRRLPDSFGGISIWTCDEKVSPLPSSFFSRTVQSSGASQILWGFGILTLFLVVFTEFGLFISDRRDVQNS